jgi:hypothetical protein
VSLQSLVLVPDPYFNEPGYESSRDSLGGKRANKAYNAAIRQVWLGPPAKKKAAMILGPFLGARPFCLLAYFSIRRRLSMRYVTPLERLPVYFGMIWSMTAAFLHRFFVRATERVHLN